MATLAQVAKVLQPMLTTEADAAARRTQFVRRRSKLTGARFVQTLVLGSLAHPQPSLSTFTQTAAQLGVVITAQGLEARWSRAAAECLKQVLDTCVGQMVAADPVAIPVLQRFSAVVVQDSTTVTLPPTLASVWQGSRNQSGQVRAAVKLQVSLDLLTGKLGGPQVSDDRTPDRAVPLPSLPAGALRLADLGYFSVPAFRALADRGVWALSRWQARTSVCALDGTRLDLEDLLPARGGFPLEREVLVGSAQPLRVRLLAVAVPAVVANQRRRRLRVEAKRRGRTVRAEHLHLAGWTILLTTAPATVLSLEEALVLVRARWQLELLFKLWKSHGQIATSQSHNRWRVLCEFYAKLIAMVVQHWLMLLSAWAAPNRSWLKTAQSVRATTVFLLGAVRGCLTWSAALRVLRSLVADGCRMARRTNRPPTFQRLLALCPAGLA